LAEGIDVSHSGVEYARNILGVKATVGLLEKQNATEWRAFDAVTLWATIEHLVDPLSVLRSIHENLKPGGIILCDTGLGNICWEKLLPGHSQWYDAPQHMFVFSKKGLVVLLEKAGFEVVHINTNYDRSLLRRCIRYIRHAALCIAGGFFIAPLLGRRGFQKMRQQTKWPIGRLITVVAQKRGCKISSKQEFKSMVSEHDNSFHLGKLAVIILTYNEEPNLAQALKSVSGWANETFILDSHSTDRTLEIARQYGCHIALNKFENYARQRNYALDRLPIQSEWIFFMDADEWVPDALKLEISTLIAASPVENGYFLSWRLIWMGRWIKRGYYPTWILRLFRHGKVRCEDRSVNEHLIVEGGTSRLRNDFMHEDRKGVTEWIDKHNDRSTREAQELLNTRSAPDYQEIDASLFGTQAQRKRWLRYNFGIIFRR